LVGIGNILKHRGRKHFRGKYLRNSNLISVVCADSLKRNMSNVEAVFTYQNGVVPNVIIQQVLINLCFVIKHDTFDTIN